MAMNRRTQFGLAVAIGILSLGTVSPASAEFFGCNDAKTTVRTYTNAPRTWTAARTSYAHVSRSRTVSSWSFSASGKRRQWH
jgi:hypothetical protein